MKTNFYIFCTIWSWHRSRSFIFERSGRLSLLKWFSPDIAFSFVLNPAHSQACPAYNVFWLRTKFKLLLPWIHKLSHGVIIHGTNYKYHLQSKQSTRRVKGLVSPVGSVFLFFFPFSFKILMRHLLFPIYELLEIIPSNTFFCNISEVPFSTVELFYCASKNTKLQKTTFLLVIFWYHLPFHWSKCFW